VLGRGGIADDGPQHDQAGALGFSFGPLVRCLERIEVVAVVHVEHLPAVRLEPRSDVFREGQPGVTVDRDVVVVVQHFQLAQTQVTRKRAGLVRYPFHHVAVAREDPGAMVHELVSRTIEPRADQRFGDRHADGVSQTLAERAGGGFDPDSVSMLGVARSPGAPLPEVLDLLE